MYLLLNLKINYRNLLLSDETKGESVGYRCADGEVRHVPWLGFIDRCAAKTLPNARPVRLVNVSRVGRMVHGSPQWIDILPGCFVHGCLVSSGVFAVYDKDIALILPKTRPAVERRDKA